MREFKPELRDLDMRFVDSSRRHFLAQFGLGLGGLGLTDLLASQQLLDRGGHFPARAKRVIHIFCSGGPSHVDTFDPKPALAQWEGKDVPEVGGAPLPSPFGFERRGESGIEMSALFPKLGAHADKLAVLRAMHTDTPEHKSAQLMTHTGSGRLPRPSLGSWTLYGLGTVNQNLPGFVAIGNGGFGGAKCWNSGFLPSVYQGTQIRAIRPQVEQMIANIHNPKLGGKEQRRQLDLTQEMNRIHAERHGAEADLEARIAAFELAFNMQTEASEAFDVSGETELTKKLYGKQKLGQTLLVARRLVESGVRFVQVWHGSWDHHTDIKGGLSKLAGEADEPIAALLTDLELRGLLDDTLVLWGGEFGRTPGYDRSGGSAPGRDHHSEAYSMWMAGGGVRGGVAHGETDDFGMRGVSGRVHIHDLHATILHLLGFDHTRLTYRYNGRDFRLTDVHGHVVREILS